MGKKREKLRVLAQRKKAEREQRDSSSPASIPLNGNLYEGCRDLDELPRLSAKTVSPEAFFQDFIATRTPALFTDHLADEDWLVSKKRWTHDYLRSRVPASVTLKVEYRESDKESFGRGQEQFMSFHEFLRRIEQGDDSLYLTTQELEYDPEGQPYVLTAPLSYLSQDFPVQPSLFQNLVISNINLWYGQTARPTTSGLHHDFHDNLYVMLRGEKTITLLSPHYAEDLYTEGEIARIHANGRVNYVNQLTEADGRDLQAEKALEAAQRLQEAALKLEQCEDDEAEDEMDRALEAVLDAEVGEDDFQCSDEDDFMDDDDEEDGDEGEEDEDDEESDEREGDEGFQSLMDFVQDELDDEDGDENEESEEKEASVQSKKRRRDEMEDEKPVKHKTAASAAEVKTVKDKGRPKSFSKVDTSLSDKVLKRDFPRYLEARKHAITVTLHEGEMLYIPAGWFHEVKSQGAHGHIAFNYWFHPPDKKDFHQPYQSDFWRKNFESRKIQKPIVVPSVSKDEKKKKNDKKK